MAKEEKKGEVIIDPKARVKVYATDKSSYHTKNEPMYVGKQLAEKLIKQGKASATPAPVQA